MASSLVRGKYVISKVQSRTEATVIEDGAVLQRDGKIVEIGRYEDLAARHRADEIIGSSEHVVVPGFVNSHHHVGLTPFQLGSPDYALELWFASRMAARRIDLYLDTLYSAFEMVESGITTVQHLHGWVNGPLEQIQNAAHNVLRAYADIGMRASYSFSVRDQNRLVYEADEDFARRLPAELGAGVAAHLKAQAIPLEDNFALFESLHGEYRDHDRLRIQLAPANLHWCSDQALRMLKDCSEKYGVPMHMHLLETAYQKEYARRRGDMTAVAYLDRFGLLGPSMTLGHGVWLTEADIERAAASDTRICHNCSSNLRLRSGVAPLNAFEKRGMKVGIGLDEAGINDDRDMLQEMRMVLRVHRVPGMDDDDVPTCPQVLRMATEHGAATTPFASEIGKLEPGRAADLVLLRWRDVAYPYLDRASTPVEAVVHRAKAGAVDTVLVAGEAILREGRFTRVDKAALLEELAASLRVPLTDEEERRRRLAKQVFPHVKKFYDGYLAGEVREPYYLPSSRR